MQPAILLKRKRPEPDTRALGARDYFDDPPPAGEPSDRDPANRLQATLVGPARKLGLAEAAFEARPGPGAVLSGIRAMEAVPVAVAEEKKAEADQESEDKEAAAASSWLHTFFFG